MVNEIFPIKDIVLVRNQIRHNKKRVMTLKKYAGVYSAILSKQKNLNPIYMGAFVGTRSTRKRAQES